MLSLFLTVIQDEKSKSKFENIYYAYHDKMLNIAYAVTKNQYDAEDALSSALYSIAKNIDKIDDSNEILLKSYLFKAVKNASIDLLRKKWRTHCESIDELSGLPSESDVMEKAVGDEEYKMLVKTIYGMPNTYKDVLVLHLLHGLKIREISDTLFINSNSVKTKIRRGKKILAEVLRNER